MIYYFERTTKYPVLMNDFWSLETLSKNLNSTLDRYNINKNKDLNFDLPAYPKQILRMS
tara:strand:+ start:796 stop:972 length:177 start_codon:yes stop_codon:yes gene_type:complete